MDHLHLATLAVANGANDTARVDSADLDRYNNLKGAMSKFCF